MMCATRSRIGPENPCLSETSIMIMWMFSHYAAHYIAFGSCFAGCLLSCLLIVKLTRFLGLKIKSHIHIILHPPKTTTIHSRCFRFGS